MQRYFAKNKMHKQFILEDSDIHHILKVMRMKDKDLIEVVFEKKLYLAELAIDKNNVIVTENKIIDELEKKQTITIVVPLLKEQKLDYILQKATELGVDEIIVIPMQYSVVKIVIEKENQKIERWTRICKEASEQAKRLSVPVIRQLKNITEIDNNDYLALICSTRTKDNTIRNFLQNNKRYDKIIIAIGPEGGFSELEETTFINKGFIPVSLGKNIMRVETVPIFVLSIINYENME